MSVLLRAMIFSSFGSGMSGVLCSATVASFVSGYCNAFGARSVPRRVFVREGFAVGWLRIFFTSLRGEGTRGEETNFALGRRDGQVTQGISDGYVDRCVGDGCAGNGCDVGFDVASARVESGECADRGSGWFSVCERRDAWRAR